MAEPIRVLVVDDSPLARRVLTGLLEATDGLCVTATAPSGEAALPLVEAIAPDVIAMAIEMPGMGGLEAITRIMATRPTPIIALSSYTAHGAELAFQALDRGAVDFLPKPSTSPSGGTQSVAAELAESVRRARGIHAAAYARARRAARRPRAARETAGAARLMPQRDLDLAAIGASTGGPAALKILLAGVTAHFPVGIVLVQHMPPIFTAAFADRLDSLCAIRVKEAAHGDRVLPAHAYVAPGGFHLTVSREGGLPVLSLDRTDPVNGQRPSIDVLMRSIAAELGPRALAVAMTGSGRDGVEGFAGVKARGGIVLAQDRESSMVFEMNRAVIEAGNADGVVPLEALAPRLREIVEARSPALTR
jgi:two-component system, chemotaxis family, protein-glutamate methylesterase/glutaminase